MSLAARKSETNNCLPKTLSLVTAPQVTENVVSRTEGSLFSSTMTILSATFGDAGSYFYEVDYVPGDNFQGGSLETEFTQVVVYGKSGVCHREVWYKL